MENAQVKSKARVIVYPIVSILLCRISIALSLLRYAVKQIRFIFCSYSLIAVNIIKEVSRKVKEKNMRRIVVVSLFWTVFPFFLVSCGLRTKEDYLVKYAQFITEVRAEKSNYTIEDWKQKDKEFDKFNEEYRARFEEELTWKENLLLTKYATQYNVYRIKNNIDFREDFFEIKVDELKKVIRSYKAEDIDEKIEEIVKEAEDIGDSTSLMIQDILKELHLEEIDN